jgi:hypothetical protein
LAEGWFLFSEKGKRPLGRPARKTGWTLDWLRMPRAWVVVARDDRGGTVSQVTGLHRPRRAEIEGVLRTAVARDNPEGAAPVVVARHGPLSPAAMAARSLGIAYERGGFTPTPAYDYLRQLMRWLRPFKGVATRYLPNYLAWHRSLATSGATI